MTTNWFYSRDAVDEKNTNKSKIDRVNEWTLEMQYPFTAVTAQKYTIVNILMSPIELHALTLVREKQKAINTENCTDVHAIWIFLRWNETNLNIEK